MEILKGRGGSRLWNSVGMGGGISEGKGGLKHGSRPLLGMDIFWHYPLTFSAVFLTLLLTVLEIEDYYVDAHSVILNLNTSNYYTL